MKALLAGQRPQPGGERGAQVFLRSAWEGAKAYRDSSFQDPAVPQRLVDALVVEAVERLQATYP